MLQRVVPCLLLLVLATGCASETGAQGDAVAGNNRPSDTASTNPADPPSAEPAEGASPTPATESTLPFGATFAYGNGVSITISAPKAFKPNEFGQIDGAKGYVAFNVTIVNKGTERYDPNLFSATLQSANAEAQQVFDGTSFLGSPTTKVLPGRETKFKIGFGVLAPTDLVMEASPGFDFKSAIWTT